MEQKDWAVLVYGADCGETPDNHRADSGRGVAAQPFFQPRADHQGLHLRTRHPWRAYYLPRIGIIPGMDTARPIHHVERQIRTAHVVAHDTRHNILHWRHERLLDRQIGIEVPEISQVA